MPDDFVREQYRRHSRAIFSKCFQFSRGDAAWAEDVTHDVFLRLLEKQHELKQPERVESWLHTVARRICVDRIRRERGVWHRIKQALTASVDVPPPGPDHSFQLKSEAEAVLGILRHMKAEERMVILMKHVDGMSQKAIALELGFSEGYVSKLLSRATKKVRKAGWELTDD